MRRILMAALLVSFTSSTSNAEIDLKTYRDGIQGRKKRTYVIYTWSKRWS
jgi:hypothetical protein